MKHWDTKTNTPRPEIDPTRPIVLGPQKIEPILGLPAIYNDWGFAVPDPNNVHPSRPCVVISFVPVAVGEGSEVHAVILVDDEFLTVPLDTLRVTPAVVFR